MSLRIRLIVSILLVLLLSLGIGGLSAGWNAAQSVRIEMQAALAVGEQTIRNGIGDLTGTRDPLPELDRLVRAFDGDRHVRAMLVDGDGRVLAASALLVPPHAVPAWFIRCVAPALEAVRLPITAGMPGSRIVLHAEPLNEVAEVWSQLRDSLVVLALFCGLSTVLVSLVVGRALRPLDEVVAAFAAVGSGEYAVRLPPVGAPELRRLAQGFNVMAERLGTAEARNHRLHKQIITLQEEERAELARDLHDEVGPFLFAVALDAAAIEQAAADGRLAAIPENAQTIRQAVDHMQRHVKFMLTRLRPANPVEIGLTPALRNLVAFWQARRPEITFLFDVAAEEDRLDEADKAVIYRVVQEGLTNAVRHGQPKHIEVSLVMDVADGVVLQVSDDGIGLAGTGGAGFGLAGMRERVAARGGSITVTSRAGGSGLTVTARLPPIASRNDASQVAAA